MKPDFLKRKLHSFLRCTSILEFQKLALDVCKVREYHGMLVNRMLHEGRSDLVKHGQYVNGHPKDKADIAQRRMFWKTYFLATEEQQRHAKRSAKQQERNL